MNIDWTSPPFQLPALDGHDAPAFDSAAAAKEWANALPLANPAEVVSQLATEIDRLNRIPLAPAERLAIFDALRKAVNFAEDECAKRYGGRPLPLAFGEQTQFDQAQALRRACVAGCLRALADSLEGNDGNLQAQALQRTLAHLASLQLESLRARRQLPPLYWRQLHGLLAQAEVRGLATTPVRDAGRHGDAPVTPLAAYGEAVLLHMASPFELPPRQLAWMGRWARRWGAKLALAPTPPSNLEALPLTVDLTSDLPPRHKPFPAPGGRLLLTHELRKSIKSRLALLAQGRSPADLQLGDDCTQPACESLLKQLYPRWCKGGQPRGEERRPEDAPGYAIFGFEGIHYHLSGGKRIKQSTEPSIADLRREREQLATFGTLETHAPQPGESGTIPPVETDWQVKDESASGVRMARPGTSKGTRMQLGQLVAVEPPGTGRPFLASIRWLVSDVDAWVQAGAQLMPGPAKAIAQRATDGGTHWLPGFLLPAFPVRSEPASAVLPAGTFRVGRQVQLQEGGVLKLTRVLERGEDYERVAYE